ncbi:SWIB/MDM2 domain superfamily protein [Hibiscus syriacus]|uniref:SWIB/MDM2 domain superfamily protein n=1 Tax=Hibiscus syriacus TaxID=106335 RepID=A0A6A3D6D0_HIBSY|nr:SWIB/MDM2 domain superfamily protein [Hibiscus syriacus]
MEGVGSTRLGRLISLRWFDGGVQWSGRKWKKKWVPFRLHPPLNTPSPLGTVAVLEDERKGGCETGENEAKTDGNKTEQSTEWLSSKTNIVFKHECSFKERNSGLCLKGHDGSRNSVGESVDRRRQQARWDFGQSVDVEQQSDIHCLKEQFRTLRSDYFVGGQPTRRFSNGRIATDFILEAFRIKPVIPAYLDPKYDIRDFATGVSFASAGTGYDNATSDVLSVIPFWKEMEYYRDISKLRGELLHFPTRSSQYPVDKYEDFLIGIASNLIRSSEGSNNRPCSDRMFSVGKDNMAKVFNVKLQGTITEMNQELGGIQVVMLNIYEKLLEMIRNPTRFGFENAEHHAVGLNTSR